MATLSELEEKAAILFPSPLNDSELKGFFDYLANHGNYDINYIKEVHGKSGSFSEEYASKVVGRINRQKIFAPSVEFSLGRDFRDEDYSSFSGIKFSSPGLDFDEIPKEEIALWDDVRKYINQYFSQKMQAFSE